jgi:uncharacterized iron-regulated membrane protein
MLPCGPSLTNPLPKYPLKLATDMPTQATQGHAPEFVIQANHDGRTSIAWSETTIRRVSSYLTGCCADFGLLESGAKSVRRFRGELDQDRDGPAPGKILGTPGKLAVDATAVAMLALTLTGVYLWWLRKRQNARRRTNETRQAEAKS